MLLYSGWTRRELGELAMRRVTAVEGREGTDLGQGGDQTGGSSCVLEMELRQ